VRSILKTPESIKGVCPQSKRFRNKVNASDRFVNYRTFVGYEFVFPLEADVPCYVVVCGS
jgi:hypothetical protein